MKDKHVKLHVGTTGNTSYIEVDGERLSFVTGVELKVKAREVTELVVTMIPNNMDVEIEREVWDKVIGKAD